jgi:KaiC/GvpD/RAD55 family RecA-like ATPase
MPAKRGMQARGQRPRAEVKVPDANFSSLNGLAKFLRLRGNTLLIKGYAGAGKTTLALQLMKGLAPNGGGVYVSSRVSEEKIHHELPWLTLKSEGRKKGGSFRDLRLGSAASFLEEILRVMEGNKRAGPPPVVVLDTWDGIAKEMDSTERLKAEKTLIALADASKTRMIFVSEEPERTTMDYLVDGMIELKRGEEFGRVFREVEVQKLRGTLIDQHKYLYTLVDGMFRQLHPYSVPDYSTAKRFEPIPDSGDMMSFGSPHLDHVFGGLTMGGTFTAVYDEKVPFPALRLVEVSTVVNALNLGRGVLIVPLPGASKEEIAGLIRPFVSPEAYHECLAIGSLGTGSELEPPFYSVSDANLKETSGQLTELIKRIRNHSELKSVIAVESVGSFEGSYASRIEFVLEGIAKRVAATREIATDTLLVLLQNDSVIRSRILAMSGRYARIFMKDRSVVIMGEKPGTPAYVMGHAQDNPLRAELTLIV